ncbi:MAG: flagellar basal body P-ring formation chaperone FlgA [Verrucomicrobia bacterium]|nr:flagellar basal body P-ring formation chaperone FlgA [Verrucomicrobiota bacterium]
MKVFSAFFVSVLSLATLSASELGSILSPVAYAPAQSSPASQFGDAEHDDQAPSVVTSSGESTIVERDVIVALQRELIARYSIEGDLKLSFLQPWKPIEIKNAKDWKLVLDLAPNGGLTSTSQVRFHIESNGKALRAQIWRPIWFSTRRLDRGEIPDGSICTPKSFDILSEKLSFVPANTDLSISEMAQTVTPERPLSWRDITLRPLVRKGQLVDVVVAEGSMNISMKGISLGNGGAGEMVSVRNLDSRKEFSAKVINLNTVQVKF